jgi:hypothetical protein
VRAPSTRLLFDGRADAHQAPPPIVVHRRAGFDTSVHVVVARRRLHHIISSWPRAAEPQARHTPEGLHLISIYTLATRCACVECGCASKPPRCTRLSSTCHRRSAQVSLPRGHVRVQTLYWRANANAHMTCMLAAPNHGEEMDHRSTFISFLSRGLSPGHILAALCSLAFSRPRKFLWCLFLSCTLHRPN